MENEQFYIVQSIFCISMSIKLMEKLCF